MYHTHHKSNTRIGTTVLVALGVGSTIYNTIRHPIKMFELVVLGVPWYD